MTMKRILSSALIAAFILSISIAAVGETNVDPHAQHKKMMGNKSYQRSVHTYDVGDIGVMRSDTVETTLSEVIADDKAVMVHFIFTTCTTICPVQAATFSQVQRQLGDEVSNVQMLSVSIDPEYDTPSRLQEYAKKFRAGPQWDFVTGTTEQMIRVQRAFDAYEGSKMNHKPLTLLRAVGTEEWVRLDGLASASDIIKEYRQLKSTS